MAFAAVFGLLFSGYWLPSDSRKLAVCTAVLLGCVGLSLAVKHLSVKRGSILLGTVAVLAITALGIAGGVQLAAVLLLPVGIVLVNLANRRNNYEDAMNGAWVTFSAISRGCRMLFARMSIRLFGKEMAVTLFGRLVTVSGDSVMEPLKKDLPQPAHAAKADGEQPG